MRDGFIKVAAGTPQIRVADCRYNAEQIFTLMREADKQGVRVPARLHAALPYEKYLVLVKFRYVSLQRYKTIQNVQCAVRFFCIFTKNRRRPARAALRQIANKFAFALTLHYLWAMFLKKISLLNFKNIEQAELALCRGVNCLVGDNGAGKTNVIDAVYYLSMCKSSLPMTD